MEILDCTLRDGNHALAGGFKPDVAAKVIAGLLATGVRVIEFGRASGIGSTAGNVSDEDYLEAAADHLGKGEIGMFCRPEFFGDRQRALATEYKLSFLRVGTHAGMVEKSSETLPAIRNAGIKVRYSLIQAHMLTSAELAESARKIVGYGAQSITIMDSTGTMMPDEVREGVSALVDAVDIPIGFHGHNNLGLSVANAIAAVEAGAQSVDGALMGLARSAGNAPTEMLAAVLERAGWRTGVDLFRLLDFVESGFLGLVGSVPAVPPLDLVFGLAGFHSKNLPVVKAVAEDTGTNLFRLVAESVKLGQATLDEASVRDLAARFEDA